MKVKFEPNIYSDVFYAQSDFPVFQNVVYETKAEAISCPKGDISIVMDKRTGLVVNSKFDQKLMNYDKKYQNEQSHSMFFMSHLNDVSEIIKRHFNKRHIVEIGCGKGAFLEKLHLEGLDISGYDPTYEGENPRIKKLFYRPSKKKQFDGIILRHVLEHISQPFDFLNNLKDHHQNSLIYIEVPCFDWICSHRAWYDIYYEHANYFRMSDFFRMFEDIKEYGSLFNGQYIYCVANINSFINPDFRSATPLDFPKDFTKQISALAMTSKTSITIWGGASKGVIFALLMERAKRFVINVIDINPAKIGKHLPATGIKVSHPSEALSQLSPGDTIFIMNSNYFSEIVSASKNSFNYVCLDKM